MVGGAERLVGQHFRNGIQRGFTASSRARQLCVASRLDISRAAITRAISTALKRHNSLLIDEGLKIRLQMGAKLIQLEWEPKDVKFLFVTTLSCHHGGEQKRS
ncbi:hypothetical protein PSAC2689_80087 [Paraburkholderia sacchari]|uniref:hypothetical protein n=1 Tax=Paraburkholderia sacchari TaxID=159450 RepID=UPI0039A4427D